MKAILLNTKREPLQTKSVIKNVEDTIQPTENDKTLITNDIESVVPEEAIEKPRISSSIPSPISKPEKITDIKSLFDSHVKRHLRAIELEAMNSLAVQASRQFQYEKTHPMLSKPPAIKTQFDEPQPIKVQLECDSETEETIGKALGVISGLLYNTQFGQGPIGCEPAQEFQRFIDKRLGEKVSGTWNKTTLQVLQNVKTESPNL